MFIRDAPPGGRRTGGPGWWFVTEAIMPHVSLIRLKRPALTFADFSSIIALHEGSDERWAR